MARFVPLYMLHLLTVINIYIICLLIHTTQKSQLSLARPCELVAYDVQRRINLKIIKNKLNHGSGKGSTQRTWLVLKWIKLKLVSAIFIKLLFFYQMITLQKLKNAFYYIEKTLFVLKILEFLYSHLPLFFSLSVMALEDDWR